MKLSYWVSSLVGVFFFSIVEIGLAIIAYQIWVRHAFQISPVYKGLICIALCIAVIILTGVILLSDNSKPSPVDITPLAELNESEIISISQRINELQHYPFERYTHDIIASTEGDSKKEVIKLYFCTLQNDGRIECSATIVITGYNSVNGATDALLIRIDRMNQKYELVKLPNSVTIAKGYSWMERGADTYYMAHERILMYTFFTINEYFIHISESSYTSESRGVPTSEFIRIIGEVLRDE